MELQYELTYDDHRAYQGHLTNKLDLGRPTPLRLLAPAVIGAAFALYLVTRPPDMSPARLGVEFGIGLTVVAFLLKVEHFFRKRILDRVMREKCYGGGPTEHVWLTLEPDCLATQSQWSSGRLLWAAVRDIEQTDTHIFIMFPNGAVIIIPKRAFDSAQHMQTFLDEMNRLRAQAAVAAASAQE